MDQQIVQRWPTDHVTQLTKGNPTRKKKKENAGNAETKVIYLKMNVVLQKRRSVGNVVTLVIMLKYVEVKTVNRKKVFSVEDDVDDEIFAINLSPEEEPEVEFVVGGQKVRMLIDSGASCNVIDYTLWKQFQSNGIVCKSQSENKCIKSYATASKVRVETKFWATVEIGGKSLSDVEFLVIANEGRPIGLLQLKVTCLDTA